jgi:hypothetical protein
MNKLIKKLEDVMVAITFAEAGEYDEANVQGGIKRPAREEPEKPLNEFKKPALENAGK